MGKKDIDLCRSSLMFLIYGYNLIPSFLSRHSPTPSSSTSLPPQRPSSLPSPLLLSSHLILPSSSTRSSPINRRSSSSQTHSSSSRPSRFKHRCIPIPPQKYSAFIHTLLHPKTIHLFFYLKKNMYFMKPDNNNKNPPQHIRHDEKSYMTPSDINLIKM